MYYSPSLCLEKKFHYEVTSVTQVIKDATMRNLPHFIFIRKQRYQQIRISVPLYCVNDDTSIMYAISLASM